MALEKWTIERLEERLVEIIDGLFAAQARNDYVLIEAYKIRKNNIEGKLRAAREQLENELDNCPSVYDGL